MSKFGRAQTTEVETKAWKNLRSFWIRALFTDWLLKHKMEFMKILLLILNIDIKVINCKWLWRNWLISRDWLKQINAKAQLNFLLYGRTILDWSMAKIIIKILSFRVCMSKKILIIEINKFLRMKATKYP